MLPDEQREKRRESFNAVAAQYDASRPGYPEAVFEDLAHLTSLRTHAHLLEIGSGTGHATLPFAERGYRIDCIELGAEMAAVAQVKLAAFPNVTITVTDFDNWRNETRYDLSFSASAYHWLNPATRARSIAAQLAPGGHVATLRNIHVLGEASAKLNAATQRIYAEVAPALAQEAIPRAEDVQSLDTQEWQSSGLYRSAQSRAYRWTSKLTARDYVRMLDTHSDHRLLPEKTREELFKRLISLLGNEFGGVTVKEYVTLLQLAEKIE